jgi:hypothetical protein
MSQSYAEREKISNFDTRCQIQTVILESEISKFEIQDSSV